MRISDCSSDVCSSDLLVAEEGVGADAEVLLHREGGEHRLAARELHKSGGHPLLGGSAGDVLAVEVDLAAAHRHQARHRLEKGRSEEHTSELQSLMRISYAVFCLKKKLSNQLENISNRLCY